MQKRSARLVAALLLALALFGSAAHVPAQEQAAPAQQLASDPGGSGTGGGG